MSETEREGVAPENRDEEAGRTAAADTLPGVPSEDDTALGDTDQHSEG